MNRTRTLRSILFFSAHRGPTRLLLGVALLLFSLPVAARPETSNGDEPVHFLIETIQVEGVERAATREIVSKESRIATGTEVDEEQLRQAIYRVRRLPFVIDADFSLQKGSERGRYVLVIRIEMASAVFANAFAGTSWERGESGGGKFDYFGSVSARHFIGSRGYAFGTIDRFQNLQIGYTQFHLFGPGSYLSVAASTSLENDRDGNTAYLTAGKPLSARQALRIVGVYSDSRDFTSRSATLEWSFDTTDDPLLPTRGEVFSASAGYGFSRFSPSECCPELGNLSSQGREIRALARRYWPLAARHSIWGEVQAFETSSRSSVQFGPVTSQTTTEGGSVGLGYAWDLLRSEMGEPRNDLRLSLRTNFAAGALEHTVIVRDLSLQAGLVYRRPQGSVSLTFAYVDSRESLRFIQ